MEARVEINSEHDDKLQQHLAGQEVLSGSLNETMDQLQADYLKRGARLKESLKIYLNNCLKANPGKIIINLVDIQNDFVLKQGAAYVPGAENVVFSNMALLTALDEIIQKNPIYFAGRFEILITLNERTVLASARSSDLSLNANSSPQMGNSDEAPIEQEKNMSCLVGTPGAAIPKLIETQLVKFTNILPVYRFVKSNSNIRAARMVHSESDIEGVVTFNDYLKRQQTSSTKVVVTGIVANESVKYTANLFGDEKFKVEVLDSCVHYKIPSGKTYRDVLAETRLYFGNKVDYAMPEKRFTTIRSNPEFLQSEQARAFYDMTQIGTELKKLYDYCDSLDENDTNSLDVQAMVPLTTELKRCEQALLDSSSQELWSTRVNAFKVEALAAIKIAKDKFPQTHPVIQLLAAAASFIVSLSFLGTLNWATGRRMFGLFPVGGPTEQKLDLARDKVSELIPEVDWSKEIRYGV